MGNAQSYTRRSSDGMYVMHKVCLTSDDGDRCKTTEIPIVGGEEDEINAFYRIKNLAQASASYTGSVLHTADQRHVFFSRNALLKNKGQQQQYQQDNKSVVMESIVKPMYYFSQHPRDDIHDESVKQKIKDSSPPPGFCLQVQPCDTLMQGFCCPAPATTTTSNHHEQGCTVLYSSPPSSTNPQQQLLHTIIMPTKYKRFLKPTALALGLLLMYLVILRAL